MQILGRPGEPEGTRALPIEPRCWFQEQTRCQTGEGARIAVSLGDVTSIRKSSCNATWAAVKPVGSSQNVALEQHPMMAERITTRREKPPSGARSFEPASDVAKADASPRPAFVLRNGSRRFECRGHVVARLDFLKKHAFPIFQAAGRQDIAECGAEPWCEQSVSWNKLRATPRPCRPV